MFTMLSGLAAHERDMIRERSISGTERLAHGEPWLGGVVPYGYRIEGERSTAQVFLSEERIDGLAL
jgi:site-specific DNA recombinase